MKKTLLFICIALPLMLAGCSAVESTGEAVDSAGRGVDTAVTGVAHGTGEVISGTGEAIEDGTRRTIRRGY